MDAESAAVLLELGERLSQSITGADAKDSLEQLEARAAGRRTSARTTSECSLNSRGRWVWPSLSACAEWAGRCLPPMRLRWPSTRPAELGADPTLLGRARGGALLPYSRRRSTFRTLYERSVSRIREHAVSQLPL
jgi:hypothetical protein